VTPQDELAQVHGPHELRLLLDSSREHGTLAAAEHELLTAMLQVQQTTVDQVMIGIADVVTVAHDADATEIERVSRDSGRSRLVVTDPNGDIVGVVHVRDAVRATTAGPSATAASLMTEPHTVHNHPPVARTVRTMREARAQLAVVVDDNATPQGVVALEDLLEEIIGEFDDETDAIPTAVRHAAEVVSTQTPPRQLRR
jgi:CBS domain containing-hemolysin-like protein